MRPIRLVSSFHTASTLVTVIVTSTYAAASSLEEDLSRLFRRETCGEDISAQCKNGPQACLEAICASCADYPPIAQCCALSSLTLMDECIINAQRGATQSSIPVAAASTTSTTEAASLSSELASPDATACVNLNSVYDGCSASISGFTAEPFSQRASCVCYSSSTWVPSRWDGLFSSCLGFYSTANASIYSSVLAETDFPGFSPCSSLGDIVGGGGGPAAVSATTTTTRSSMMLLINTTSPASSPSGGTGTSSTTTSWHFIGTTPASNQPVVMTVTMTVGPSATGASSGASRLRWGGMTIYVLIWSGLVGVILWEG